MAGAYHMPEGGTPEILRDAGFNAYRTLAFGHEVKEREEVPPSLEGIFFWSYIYDRADFSKSPEYESQLRQKIEELRAHPGLLCYENYNEPTMTGHYHTNVNEGQFKTQPENLAVGTAVVRDLDPNHPIWLAHSWTNTVETLRRFNDCLDIVGCNPYPLYVQGMRRHTGVRPDGKLLDCIDQSVHAVGKYTDKMMAVAQGRPVWMLLQAMANEHWFNPLHTPEYAGQEIDPSKILYPTLEQMRFMVYDAVTSGATGVALSMVKTPTTGDVWENIKRLVGELRSLHDALCAPPVTGDIRITYTDLGFTIWDGVQAIARRLGKHIYLFAVNTAFDPAEVQMRLPVDVGNVAEVVGSGREVAVENSVISDRIEPYGAHVYRLESKA